ncbi:hypothetical protein HDU91_002843 [Kappamyces sp. JEL0680]|nr:hypothetical protein HDU91_002843 [Kappamyces sp. JEL0680]
MNTQYDDPTVQAVPMPGYWFVYGLGFPLMQLSFLASLYVLVRIIRKGWKEGSLPLALRFPFYIAITDLLGWAGHMNNQLYPMITGHTRPIGAGCTAASMYVAFAVFSNMSLIASIALLSYLTVCRHYKLDFGVYDWKLFVIVLVLSLIMAALGASSSGPSYYWCFFQPYSSKLFPIITAVVEVGMFNVVLVCFVLVWRTIRGAALNKASVHSTSSITAKSTSSWRRDEESSSQMVHYSNRQQGPGRGESVESVATRKMLLYTFNYFLTWGPTVPYVIGGLVDYYGDWTYVLTNVSINLGGILNAAALIRNEGIFDKYNQ